MQVIYNMLIPRVKAGGFLDSDLPNQLFREYGVHVEVEGDSTLDLRHASRAEEMAVADSLRATWHGMALQRQGIVL